LIAEIDGPRVSLDEKIDPLGIQSFLANEIATMYQIDFDAMQRAAGGAAVK
jgi:hypothetical protein